jgi:hypothetical protein
VRSWRTHSAGKETYSVPKDLSSTISDSVSSHRALPETAGADAGFGNLGGGRPRPSAYICLRQQRQRDSAAYRAYVHGHRRSVRVYGARRDVTRPPRFEMKELGEVTMVSMAHVADAFRELLG